MNPLQCRGFTWNIMLYFLQKIIVKICLVLLGLKMKRFKPCHEETCPRAYCISSNKQHLSNKHSIIFFFCESVKLQSNWLSGNQNLLPKFCFQKMTCNIPRVFTGKKYRMPDQTVPYWVSDQGINVHFYKWMSTPACFTGGRGSTNRNNICDCLFAFQEEERPPKRSHS